MLNPEFKLLTSSEIWNKHNQVQCVHTFPRMSGEPRLASDQLEICKLIIVTVTGPWGGHISQMSVGARTSLIACKVDSRIAVTSSRVLWMIVCSRLSLSLSEATPHKVEWGRLGSNLKPLDYPLLIVIKFIAGGPYYLTY